MRRAAIVLICTLFLGGTAAEAGMWVHGGSNHYWGHHWYHPWGWYGWGSWYGLGPRTIGPVGPTSLAVVDTDVSPERARLYLDGEFIGIADDFDGMPDYLYLRPGSYQLEAQLGGYESQTIPIDAEKGQVYVIDFKLMRNLDQPKEEGRPARPDPLPRLFEPKGSAQAEAAAPPQTTSTRPRPDLALRPELRSRRGALAPAPEQRLGAASLHLKVSPDNASVYLDGTFVATASELGRLALPLAVKPGPHTIEALAPGFAAQEKSFEIAAGETLEIELTLRE